MSATAEADVAEMVFTWDATGPGELLTMALPHHLPVLSGPTETALVHNTIKDFDRKVLEAAERIKSKRASMPAQAASSPAARAEFLVVALRNRSRLAGQWRDGRGVTCLLCLKG